MAEVVSLTRTSLRTPKAAALAGIIFSVLMAAVLLLFRMSAPADPMEPGAWLATNSGAVTLALNLVPFAGVAFLWFIGVVRDRLGHHEDRFFATVFLGSGLLFLALFFSSAAAVGAIVIVFAEKSEAILDTTTLHLARAVAYNLANVYAVKMAGVFMISTSTVILYAKTAPRWMAILGFFLALILLLGSYYISWCILVLPIWVLLISIHILIDDFRLPANQTINRA